ncbi:MAG: ribonuclease III [Clostridiales bacterium]|nr:ribonuclease III [Clostridiales bacterium]
MLQIERFESLIGFSFSDKALLQTALTHSSYTLKNQSIPNNERLEFLGDSVLELCMSEILYKRFSNVDEGALTRARAKIVRESTLYEIAKRIGVGEFLFMSPGEESTGGRDKPSILSNALEAIIGAIFLDSNLDGAKDFITKFFNIEEALVNADNKDYKTFLQEFVQEKHMGEIRYEVVETTGPVHKLEFTLRVIIANKPYGTGKGNSKLEAGQNAAKKTIEMLKGAK